MCLFICLSTKAIHLELVSSLSTEAFLAAFRRYSDNGTNFVGANFELQKICELMKLNTNEIIDKLENEGTSIKWHFIPAKSPHFDGIWEANIKVVKTHISKVIGQSILTFEEFSTLLTEIEAIVNSRPLSPLSDDPSDMTPLTPAHFLIGRPLNAVPGQDYTAVKENRLSALQRIQQTIQSFWKRWH